MLYNKTVCDSLHPGWASPQPPPSRYRLAMLQGHLLLSSVYKQENLNNMSYYKRFKGHRMMWRWGGTWKSHQGHGPS